jgi:hypothetical protein
MTDEKRVRRVRDESPDGIPTTQWDGLWSEGPGATTAAIPIVEVDGGGGHGGHVLEPSDKRILIGKDDILYPIAVSLGLVSVLFGQSAGHHLADDMPEEETHPFFPDHFWPYPVIMMSMLIAMGLLSVFQAINMQLPSAANPTIVITPRPDWYFLWLFQFLKLGPEVVMAIYIPTVIILILLLWPFLDQIVGPRLARLLGWATWPVPGRNVITGTAWILLMTWVASFTFWALAGWTIFGITGG